MYNMFRLKISWCMRNVSKIVLINWTSNFIRVWIDIQDRLNNLTLQHWPEQFFFPLTFISSVRVTQTVARFRNASTVAGAVPRSHKFAATMVGYYSQPSFPFPGWVEPCANSQTSRDQPLTEENSHATKSSCPPADTSTLERWSSVISRTVSTMIDA